MVFWVVALCGEDGGRTVLRNVGIQSSHCMAQKNTNSKGDKFIFQPF